MAQSNELVAGSWAFVARQLAGDRRNHTLPVMNAQLTKPELACWALLALTGGCAAGWIDLSATAPQGPALVVMLVAFALTLPGRAPVTLVSLVTALGVPVVHAAARSPVGLDVVVVLIPAFIGAVGGRVSGRLLDSTASRLEYERVQPDLAWNQRPLSTRFLLAVGIVSVAAGGFPAVVVSLRAAGNPLPWFLGTVWQIMTLLGWIGLAPLVLRRGNAAPHGLESATGLRPWDLLWHVSLVMALCGIHAIAVVALSSVLRFPLVPGWNALIAAAAVVYVPLDLLAYLVMITLGFASDVGRHRREASERERALLASSLEARLSALRARLNPHFLFNTLNGIIVLARSARYDEATQLTEGLTALLRYVLDDRRVLVALSEELDFARQYLTVQQVRFGTRLRFDIHAIQETESSGVPQLLLQPIVENAVEHGIARTLHGGSIRVTTSREGDCLRITVEDDGPGPDSSQSLPGIGIANTRERLARLYAGRGHLTLESRGPGQAGTRVELSLPFEPYVAAG
jgi:signal transduction histidine kinase